MTNLEEGESTLKQLESEPLAREIQNPESWKATEEYSREDSEFSETTMPYELIDREIGKNIRDWTAFALGLVGAILGTLGFWTSLDNASAADRLAAKKHLNLAWDNMGGTPGTVTITSFGPRPNLELARREIELAHILTPDFPDVHRHLGTYFVGRGQHEKALEAYRTAIRLDPEFAKAYNSEGNVLRAQGKALQEQGNALQADRKLGAAAEAYRKAIEHAHGEAMSHSNLGVYYSNLGIVLQDLGSLDDAKEEFRKAIEHDRAEYLAHLNLGRVFNQQGKYDDAIDAYRAAESVNARDAIDACRAAESANARDAIDACRAAESGKAKDFLVYYNMAIAFGKLGNTDEQIRAYEDAIKVNPEDADSHFNLALVLIKERRFDDAVERLRAVTKIDTVDLEAYKTLGDVLETQGAIDDAIGVYETANRLAPEDTEIRERLEIMREEKRDMDDSRL